MIEIRQEQTEDIEAIQNINQLAFEGDAEAKIVRALRANSDNLLSLVAVEANQVIGHILFSPVTIKTEHGTQKGMGLAPMAVHPDFQRKGIGMELVRQGIEILRERDIPFVIVLGHPGYYPRFGFEPASRYNIQCQWHEVPDEAFMVLLLNDEISDKLAGTVYYREEFSL